MASTAHTPKRVAWIWQTRFAVTPLVWNALAESESALSCWREAKHLYEADRVQAGVTESEQHIRRLSPGTQA